MRKLFFSLLSLILVSCSNSSMDTEPQKFFTVSYEDILDNKKEFPLSEIASDVSYVKLETSDSCLLRRVVNYFFTDSLILIRNFDHILKFSRDGRFIQRIGKSGRGPGEIDLIRVMSVIPERRLIAAQLNYRRAMYLFSFDGKLIREIDFKEPLPYVKLCPDGRYIIHDTGASGYEKYCFALTTENWDTLSVVPNYMHWENKTGMVLTIGYNNFEEFYYAGNRMHMKSMYNDTIYSVDTDRIVPAWYLDLGKFRLPEDLRPEKLGANQIQQFRDNSDRYFWGNAFETPGRIFLATNSYNSRTPSRYILYDKDSHEGTFLSEGTEPAKGFINDWDGIIDFWPTDYINEKQVCMPVNVMELQAKIEEKSFRTARFPEKQKELIDMIMSMEPTDNPVLMVVTLK